MSRDPDTKDSEAKFHDALTEVSTVENNAVKDVLEEDNDLSCSSSRLKGNKDVIEEIIRQQADLKLPDEDRESKELESEQDKNETFSLFGNDLNVEELQEQEKTMTTEELQHNKEQSDQMKLNGNELFKSGESLRAVEIYTKALNICPTTYTKERAILFGNRAAAKINLNSKKSALDDCSKAIELWPEYVRVLMRRAKLCEQEDRLEDALTDYQKVCELDPSQREARDAVSRLPEQINDRNERLKTEMLSKLKDLGNMFLKPFGLSTENFQMQQDPKTGSYSVNFQQNPR